MWRNTKKLAMGLALASTLAGCGQAAVATHGGPNAFTGGGSGDAVIRVTNYNWSDMSVYAERHGAQIRLGSVASMATEQFKLPRELVGATDLHIIADPLGSTRVYRTRPVLVVPGQQVAFRIENNLELSTVSVW